MIENLQSKAVVTTVSMPFALYAKLVEVARLNNSSIAAIVRRALLKDFSGYGRMKEEVEMPTT